MASTTDSTRPLARSSRSHEPVEDQVEHEGELAVTVAAEPRDVLHGVLGKVRVRFGDLADERGQVRNMLVLKELLETEKVTPVIDRSHKLTEVADALRYLGGVPA